MSDTLTRPRAAIDVTFEIRPPHAILTPRTEAGRAWLAALPAEAGLEWRADRLFVAIGTAHNLASRLKQAGLFVGIAEPHNGRGRSFD